MKVFCRTVLLLCFCAATVCAAEKKISPKAWERYIQKGDELVARGDWDKAETQFVAALGEAEKFGVADSRLSSTLGKLTDAHVALHKYPQAEVVCRRQIAIDMGRLGSTNMALSFELAKLAQVEELSKKYADAQRHYQRAQDIVAKARGASSPLIGIYLSRQANVLLLQGKPDEAEAMYARALNFLDDTQFGLSFEDGMLDQEIYLIRETVRIRKEYAALCEQKGELALAERLLARAVTSLEKLSNTNSAQLPPVLNNLARVQAKQDDFTNAVATVRRSLGIVERTKSLQSMEKETRELQLSITAKKVLNEVEQGTPAAPAN